MSIENEPAKGNPAAPEAALPAGETPASVDASVENDKAFASGRKPLTLPKTAPILLGALLLIALVAAGVILAKKQLRKEGAPAAQIETQPAATTLELPAAPAPSTHAVEGPAPNKIFNSTGAAMKAGADALDGPLHAAPGTIDELPPPPAAAGNNAMQDAAKEAAKRFAPKGGAEIDLSAPDSEAALEQLERKAAAQQDFAGPSVHAAIDTAGVAASAAGLDRSDVAAIAETLAFERQRTNDQASEIARLNSELRSLRETDAPAADEARATILLNQLAAKTRSGAPFQRELEAFTVAAPQAAQKLAIEAYANTGLPPVAVLQASFAERRDEALNVARRAAATGPAEHLGASLASLVRLRPAQPLKGTRPVAVISRAEAAVAAGDLVRAVSELETLSGAPRTAFEPWIAQARARAAAERSIAAATTTDLAAVAERQTR